MTREITLMTPCKWVRHTTLTAMNGITKNAMKKKRDNGVWLEGKHYRMAPDRNYVYNWREIDNWNEGLYS